MSLTEQLEKAREASKTRIPEPALNVLRQAIKDLADTGIADNTVKAPQTAPKFALKNATGETVDLDALLDKGPVVISFYRGGWCPYCNFELKALQEKLPEIQDLGASLIAVTPEQPDRSLSTKEKNALDFDILTDEGNKVARDYGLVFQVPGDVRELYLKMGIDLEKSNGDSSWELPVPGTFVLNKNGGVVTGFVDPDYRYRVEPEKIVETLRGLQAG